MPEEYTPIALTESTSQTLLLDQPPQPKPSNNFIKFGLVICIAIILLFIAIGASSHKQPLVILISIDAFKPSYLPISPNLLTLSQKGTRAQYLAPQFPTSTFPNHWTLATGLLPSSHGIRANSFYNVELKQKFSIGTSNDAVWWKGEAIWSTVTRQRKRVGVMVQRV